MALLLVATFSQSSQKYSNKAFKRMDMLYCHFSQVMDKIYLTSAFVNLLSIVSDNGSSGEAAARSTKTWVCAFHPLSSSLIKMRWKNSTWCEDTKNMNTKRIPKDFKM